MTRASLRALLLTALVISVAGCVTHPKPKVVATRASNVELHALFSDDMVLQRNAPIRVWGWADPGGLVRVTLGDEERTVIVNDDRTWAVTLKKREAGGPHTLTVSGQVATVLENVMVGEVWVASGQSNMQWSVAQSANPAEEIAAANHPNIRLYSVPRTRSFTKLDDVATYAPDDPKPEWEVCSPDTVPGFSAVAYYFGRDIQSYLDIPIGLINTSWGGTIAEAWTSEEALVGFPVFAERTQTAQAQEPQAEALSKKYAEELAAWNETLDGYDAGSANAWHAAEYDTSGWDSAQVPGYWEDRGHASLDGFMWYQKQVTVPDHFIGQDLRLELGSINDYDRTYFNGVLVGHTERVDRNRKYNVSGDLVKAQNVITVRVYDMGNKGGFFSPAAALRLTRAYDDSDAIALAGAWRYKIGAAVGGEIPAMPVAPRIRRNNPNVPTVLHNAMIAPLVNYPITGAIWYQGESNAGRAEQYETLFPTMIEDWRAQWDQGNFPFFFVQLANWKERQTEPVEDSWAELREAQRMTLSLPNTGMATIIDIGEAGDIHPKNKQDVGKRLALATKKVTYNDRGIVYSGPMYKKMRARKGEVRIRFDHVGGGLTAEGGELEGFTVAGEDRVFKWADARIDDDSVIVSSADVPDPVAVRYGWAINPICNLYNAEGLPASPFRTDDWPGMTAGKE
jgi:sialate O-acetylesterase